ncbi:MAG: restriction endonuclease subunit S [Deltaproteobacteria bacterium]|nr:restriction endonuclease subunit S [Deltaproteobacteria bacterium]
MQLGTVLQRATTAVRVEPNAVYREIGIRSHGKGLFHKEPVTGAALGDKRVFAVVPRSLVFNIVFAWEGAVAVTSDREQGMIASHRFPMFVPTDDDLVDVGFLRRFFQSRLGIRLLGDASPGGAGRNRTLNQKFTSEIHLPVPPIREQRKIAAILSSVDDAIVKAEAVIEQVQVVKKGLMHQLLNRGMPGRHTKFKQTEIGRVPASWEVMAIGSLLESCTYGVNCPLSADSALVPVLRMGNIRNDQLDLTELRFADLEDQDQGKVLLRVGDILFNRTNSVDLVGKVALVTTERQLSYASYLLRLRTNRERCFPAWLHARLAAPDMQRRLKAIATKGVSQSNINPTRMRSLAVAVPPVGEQREIADNLRVIGSLVDVSTRNQASLSQLKVALSSALLTGRVRVSLRGGEAA